MNSPPQTEPSLKRPAEDEYEEPSKRFASSENDLFVIDTRPSIDSETLSGSEEDGELTDEEHFVPPSGSAPTDSNTSDQPPSNPSPFVPNPSNPLPESPFVPNPSVQSSPSVPNPSSTPEPIVSKREIKMRSLVNTREAGIIIGKNGGNIAYLQKETGMKVMVSQFVHLNDDRVMTCIGPLNNYSSVIHILAEQLIRRSLEVDSKQLTLRLLVPASRMGFIIGKGGAQIKEIQNKSGAQITSQNENLANSTERVMSILGDADAVSIACYEIASLIGDHHERQEGHPTLYFDPLSKANSRSSHRGRSPSSGSSRYSRSRSRSRSRSPEPPSSQSQSQQMQAQLSALYAYYPQLQLLAQYPQLLAQYQQYYQMMGQGTSQQASPLQTTIPLPGMNTQSLAGLQQGQTNTTMQGLANLQGLQALQGLQGYQGQNQQSVGTLQEQLTKYYQSAQSQPPKLTDQNGNISRELIIPNSIVGAFIGKKGASIKEMRRRTRCDVEVSEDSTGNGRRIWVSGPANLIDEAVRYVNTRVDEEFHKYT